MLLFGIVCVSFGLNGTSSGEMYGRVYSGSDPSLISGHPENIRSDEWYVNTSWSIAQVQQGLPDRNQTMPGGMDAALPHDLPRADWSVLLRPHLWGYLFLDVGHATAFKWWIAALTFIAAAFCFLVTLLPRRPILSAAIAVGFYFSPFFQWWFQTVIFWPLAWALVTMTAILWATRDKSWGSRWAWAAVIAFLTPVMAMGIYAPFIVPVVLVVIFFAAGAIVEQKRMGSTWVDLLKRAIPIAVAGALGAAITLVWLATKAKALGGFLSTSYPGTRLTPTGEATPLSAARTISSAFTESLTYSNGFLGLNSSESSTFFLVGAFMVPIVGWIVYRAVRARRALPWMLIALIAVLLIFVAFSYLPGWNAIAHLLFLDRTSDNRLRIGLGLASFAILGLVLRHLEHDSKRPPSWLSAATAALFLLSQIGVAAAVWIVEGRDRLWHDAPFWWLYALASAAVIFWFARKRFALGALAFVLVGVLGTAAVNPVYVGVFDLRKTPVSQAVVKLDRVDKGTWVGVGGVETSAILLESGVRAFNGVQGAPSATMWRDIDPTGRYRFSWNRLAGIGWMPAPGEPQVSNPAPDQILVTFDACSTFAQKHVEYVLSGKSTLGKSCLHAIDSFVVPRQTLTIYRVVPAPR
ncbi:DUF7657 domain-containing protein [Lacisediminihabitans sp. FW035]